MGDQIKSLTQERAIWEAFKRAGIVGQQTYLRFETSLQNSSSSYAWQVLQNQGVTIASEKRLAINDAFLGLKAFLYVKKAGTSATASAVTDAEQSVATPHTYPNSTVFSGSNEAANLGAVWNSGNIRAVIDRKVYWDNLDTLRFRRVGPAQQGLLFINGQATTGYQQSSWDGEDYGGIRLTPTLLLNGQGTNELSLNIPASGISMAGTSSSNFAVLITRGFLFQNGALKLKEVAFRKALEQFLN